ncbi:MAG: methyltransferase domain-containing protein [Gammaproteobacteria bacterium]|jgi:hypothetical protein|nr:methyltransferase domain-containing protein [Gammaproteobacteria bacterium]
MENSSKNNDYLCVDSYLTDFLQTQLLKSSFEIGIIDLLVQETQISLQQLCDKLSIDREGAGLIIDLLEQNRILEKNELEISITTEFLEALKYRDLLEAKIEFANFMVPDLMNNFNAYIQDIDSFMQQSDIFDLFSYHRCYESTEENLEITRKWMKYTTVLTRYETGVFLKNHNISEYKTAMDIGGNSGEFMSQMCSFHSELRGTVVDLPVVCDIGQTHIAGRASSDRVQFHKADALQHELPTGFDLVTFKSILHDWPDEAVDTYISKAYDCLSPNGEVVIFERISSDGQTPVPVFGNLPVFIFMRFYRQADLYYHLLEKHGFSDIKTISINLEMPFVLISAKK